MTKFYNAFISYGRADSKEFATKLYNCLTSAGFNIWFDQNDIPLGVDFQNQIDDGIAKADNFLFIIAPHAVNSPYCQKEINRALKYNKRIIPLLHIEQITQEIWQERNPQGTKEDWEAYQAKGLDSSLTNMPPKIGKINWVYFREDADNFDTSLAGLIEVFHSHEDYVRQHTEILAKAREWEQNKKPSRYLLIGQERQAAEAWLDIRFKEEQAPCQPSDLHCEYICESIKNANNLLTQVFIRYAEPDREVMEKLTRTLQREKITIWTERSDIKKRMSFQEKLHRGIAIADNFVYLVSPESLTAHYCQTEIDLALSYHKRIICFIVPNKDTETLPEFSYEYQVNELIKQIKDDELYYHQHKILLVQALKWQEQNHNPSILFRGYNLQHFQAWLKIAETHDHPPTDLQKEFLTASSQHQAKSLEVFISYSRTDSDLARKLNDALQFQGKTTWFDQESIAAGTDFQQEIYRGIENSDNFLFIISPHSVSSAYCSDEVEYAEKLNKRFVTILYRQVEPKTLHPALAKVQWIDFTQHEGDFYANFSELVRTLDTDRDHVQSHTLWSQRALEWEEKSQTKDLLLRGSELNVAESWLRESEAENKQPPATDLQKKFIAKSRQQNRNNRLLQIGLVAAFIILVSGAAVIAVLFGLQAKEQERKANQLATEANIKADTLFAKSLVDADPVDALIRAIQVTGRSQKDLGQVLPLVQSSLLAALQVTHERNLFKGHESGVRSVAISPDGSKIVSGSYDNTIRLWDINSGSELAVFKGHEDLVFSVAFSPDGNRIVSGSKDKTIRLWDIKSGEQLAVFKGHEGLVYSVAFSPDGSKIVSGSGENTIRLWDIKSGEQLAVFKGHESDVYSVAFSPDGSKIVSGSNDKTIRLWDIRSRSELAVFKGHESDVYSVAFSPDGSQIVSGSSDRTIRLWDIKFRSELAVHKGHKDSVLSVAFFPDGNRIVSGSYDKTIRLWDIKSGSELAVFKGHKFSVWSVAFSPYGDTIVSGSNDGTIRLWDINSGEQLALFKGHESVVSSVAFSPDGSKIVSGGSDKTIRLWDINSREQLALFKGHESNVNSVAFSPDGSKIVSGGSDKTIRLWDIKSRSRLAILNLEYIVNSVAFSPDGSKVVSGSWDRTIRLWDIKSGSELAVFKDHQHSVSSVAFSPDGSKIVSGSYDTTIRLWDINSGSELALFKGLESGVLSVAFSPDGQKIVSGSYDNTIRLWDVKSGLELAVFRGHESSVLSVAFSPDGDRIVSGSEDGMIRLWDVNSGSELALFKGHESDVFSVAFSPDGQKIVSGSFDKTIRLWLGTWQGWLEAGCNQLRLHSVFVEALIEDGEDGEDRDVAREAVKTCEEQVNENGEPIWNNQEKAEFRVRQGLAVARLTGDFAAAKEKFDQAKQLEQKFYLSLGYDPQIKAKELRASVLVSEGEKLGEEGKLAESIAKFQEAKTLDYSWDFDPEAKAKSLVAASLVNQAVELIKEDHATEALAKYKQAQELDAQLEKANLNSLCWFGSLQGYAAEVMSACDMAVERNPNDGDIRDSRGVARALTGDYAGAISDFEAYIKDLNQWIRETKDEYPWKPYEKNKAKRQGWVDALKKGKNPFTEEVLQELLEE
ncbi:TIR domain-containing protein [Planktothricoides raciborskii]|uniref:TIR domain-containing protein n=1 Tax=Planktothricoides raciborskii FACHB-1370 TaxID=2949576 RepID=A0ABR8EAZ9_9CYAN|nr:TIR domain-containing protein [Planktothricoides raciborskii]MBD2543577.1 TIR domain-containing protein [Planktothricoides raciborskii FACHB-1370]MBD2581267.1 TIR domain-containing protein [Planktothricoides raciborskii FACHB-1261]